MAETGSELGYTDLDVSPLVYAEVDRRNWLLQPNFVRSRARFRGPRETEKINLEINQMYYDLHRTRAKMDATASNLEAFIQRFEGGVSFEDIDLRAEWTDPLDPDEQTVELLSMTELARQIDRLRSRVKSLEES